MSTGYEPAFPFEGGQNNGWQPYCGMSLRDYFAAKAMQGDWAAQDEYVGEFENDLPDDAFLERAATYYRMADAMLAVREKES